MKQMYFAFVLLVLSFFSLQAQDSNGQPPTLEQLTLDEKVWLRESKFPITTYNFQNDAINTQLQLGLTERKKAKTLKTLGWVGIGAGAVMLFLPKKDGGGALTIGSVGLSLGGVVTSLISNGKKRKAQERIEQAAYLYESSQ